MKPASKIGKLVLLLFLHCLLFSGGAQGKDFYSPEGGHKKDYEECLGISEAPEAFYNCLKTFSDQIDEVKEVRSYLNQNFKGFTVPDHRYLFHWGFNDDPKKSEPLQQRVKMPKWELSDEEMKELFKYLVRKQGERNRNMIGAIERGTGLPREQSRAIATILYDVHILGDFTGKKIRALLNIQRVTQDIIKHGVGSMRFDFQERNQFEKALVQAEKNGGTEEEKANRIMGTVKAFLPPLLEKHYKLLLKEHGIRLKPQKPITTGN